jgi:arabinofuranosyltransferase
VTVPAPRIRLLHAACLSLAAIELVNTAWIGDDAAITLRSVLNVLHGYGATYNIDERVQTFTHPLWFLLLTGAAAVTRNVFVAAFALSMVTSLAVIALLLKRVAADAAVGLLAASTLLLSKAYADFAASGLENPLSHLLVIAAVLCGAKAIAEDDARTWTLFFATCSLTYLSRPDYALLVAPLALVVIVAHRATLRPMTRALLIGALPAVAWTVFSLYYYGFPFPNTAYAKLATGIPLGERVIQGGVYLRDSLTRDPLTLTAIAAGIALALRASAVERAIAVGIAIYIAYVVSIGGDFMTGRFLTTPLVAAMCIVARSKLSRPVLAGMTAALILLALPVLTSTMLSGPGFENTKIDEETGIADERGYYFHRYGLRPAPAHTFEEPPWELAPPTVVVLCADLGYTGLMDGPGTHLIDTCALADPLLARLPAERTRKWRIGHFTRQLPTDYESSVATRTNLLTDPATHRYYDSIRLITRAPLANVERLKTIARINLGTVPRPDWNMYYATKVPRSSAER